MSKINRNQFIAGLVAKGYTEKEAKKIYRDFTSVLEDQLLHQNEVNFTGIGKIVPKHTPKGVQNFLGVDQEIEETLSLVIKTSKVFKRKFRKEFSEASKTKKSIRSFGVKLSTNNLG